MPSTVETLHDRSVNLQQLVLRIDFVSETYIGAIVPTTLNQVYNPYNARDWFSPILE